MHYTERNRLAAAGADELVTLAAEVSRNERKLREFRQWLSREEKNFVRKPFGISDNLALEVFQALQEWRQRHPGFAGQAAAASEGDPTEYLGRLREGTAYIEVRGLKVGSGAATRYPIEQIYILPLTTQSAPAAKKESRRRSHPQELGPRRTELHEALRHRGCLPTAPAACGHRAPD
jgi:hypothetical protein